MKKVKFVILSVLLAFCSIASAQTEREYVAAFEKLLDTYCQEFYSDDFPDRYYREGTLKIGDAFRDPLTEEFTLKGTHDYKGQSLKVHKGVKWEATIEKIAQRKYRIKFDKWYEKDWFNPGHWERGRTRDYEYPKRR